MREKRENTAGWESCEGREKETEVKTVRVDKKFEMYIVRRGNYSCISFQHKEQAIQQEMYRGSTERQKIH